MSDEQTPPPPALRLKPRLRPVEGSASSDATPVQPGGQPADAQPFPTALAPTPAPASADAAAPKIRLRPKIASAPSEPASGMTTAPVAETIPAFVPAPAPPSAPPLFAPPPSPPASESPVAPSFAPATPAPATPAPATTPSASAAPFVSPPVKTGRTPPPFPVVAQAAPGKTAAPFPVPHVALRAQVLEPQPEVSTTLPSSGKRGPRPALTIVAALVLLAGGGFFAWQHFMGTPAASPAPAAAIAPPAAKQAAPNAAPVAASAASGSASSPASTSSTAPATPAPAPAANAPATPSETLSKFAHLPANAIGKAKAALATREASGHTRPETLELGEATPAASGSPSAQPASAAKKSTAMTALAPGLAASTQVEAASAASATFRSFVANVKVSGVFQGTPARAVLNGRLTRSGETVDAALGIVFVGLDDERRNLVFKDRSGATVARRF